MNIILDTNVFIWFSQDDILLKKKIKNIIENEKNNIFVSLATFWEIAIKKSIDKLKMELTLDELEKLCINNGIEIIPITFEHIKKIETLPDIHKDPFDRIIISQTLTENFYIATSDMIFNKYKLKII